MQKFELFMGCLGNGITVCNKAIEENGDYKKIAHISKAGNIKWYVPIEQIPGNELLTIEHQADGLYWNFRKQFESLPLMEQYRIILDSSPIKKMLEYCDDKRNVETKINDMRIEYYRTV